MPDFYDSKPTVRDVVFRAWTEIGVEELTNPKTGHPTKYMYASVIGRVLPDKGPGQPWKLSATERLDRATALRIRDAVHSRRPAIEALLEVRDEGLKVAESLGITVADPRELLSAAFKVSMQIQDDASGDRRELLEQALSALYPPKAPRARELKAYLANEKKREALVQSLASLVSEPTRQNALHEALDARPWFQDDGYEAAMRCLEVVDQGPRDFASACPPSASAAWQHLLGVLKPWQLHVSSKLFLSDFRPPPDPKVGTYPGGNPMPLDRTLVERLYPRLSSALRRELPPLEILLAEDSTRATQPLALESEGHRAIMALAISVAVQLDLRDRFQDRENACIPAMVELIANTAASWTRVKAAFRAAQGPAFADGGVQDFFDSFGERLVRRIWVFLSGREMAHNCCEATLPAAWEVIEDRTRSLCRDAQEEIRKHYEAEADMPSGGPQREDDYVGLSDRAQRLRNCVLEIVAFAAEVWRASPPTAADQLGSDVQVDTFCRTVREGETRIALGGGSEEEGEEYVTLATVWDDWCQAAQNSDDRYTSTDASTAILLLRDILADWDKEGDSE